MVLSVSLLGIELFQNMKNIKHLLGFALTLILTAASAQQSIDNTFGKGIRVIALDSSFSMTFNYRMQNLMMAEMPSGLESFGNVSSNWLVRRSRLKFSGFAYSPKLQYKIELGLSNRDHGGESPETNNTSNLILDAFIRWKVLNNFEVWLGQTKLPGNRERVISSQKLQFVDRSLVNSRYNIDRDMGIQFHNKFDVAGILTKQAFAISQGEGRNRTSDNAGGLEYTGRVEILPMGEFTGKGDYFGSDLKREVTPKLSIGASYDFNDRAPRERGNLGSYVVDTAYNSLNTVFVDLMFKVRGWSIMAEYANKNATGDRLLDDDDSFVSNYYTGTGLTIQAGYLLKNNLECAVRYSSITPELASGRDLQKMYTLGISQYIVGHSLKVQSDFSYLVETERIEGTDWGRYIFRFQVELAF